jgi:hypothetical protein
MSKTFKKSARVAEENEKESHFYKYKKSSIEKASSKNMDKYIRLQDFDKLDEMSDYDYTVRR